MFKQILVPLDGSSASESSLVQAASLAGAFSAKIHLARCSNVPPSTDFAAHASEYHESFDNESHEVATYLECVAESLRERGLQLQVHPLFGVPIEQLLKLCGQQGIDLIVMTSHGRSGFPRVLLGSVAESLARSAPCPVMIIRQAAV